jgi:putative transcriptional regulator
LADVGQRPYRALAYYLRYITNSLKLVRISYGASGRKNRSERMLRVRLKADGRLVKVLPDGSEQAISFADRHASSHVNGAGPVANGRFVDAAYARNVRGQTGLTQTAFAAQIGVPVETVRNWEQGKRSPRGPARALLKIIEGAPEAAFAVLGAKHR